MKKAQLRFAVINALPDGVAKTKYLLELLNENDMQPTLPDQPDTASRVAISSLLDE